MSRKGSILPLLGLLLACGAVPSAARASELPHVGPWDRVRVEDPDWPGAEARSETGAVLLAPPPSGTRWRPEMAPEVDRVPVDALEDVDALEGAEWLQGDLGPKVGALDAREAVAAMASGPWREEGAPRGAGVKVAVFDVQWFGAELLASELGEARTHDCQEQRSCELPMDTLRPRYAFEEGSHGVGCAETIRDIAPDAELHLVRVNGPTTLENAADWAIREGIDVVSMSMSFFHSSFHDGSGAVSGVATRLADAGVLFVVSAGNYATEHWMGAWSDAGHDGVMDFPWGTSWWPAYFGVGGGSVQLAWDDFGACGRADLDIEVVDSRGRIVGRSAAEQSAEADSCSPVERASFVLDEEGWVYARVRARSGSNPPRVSLWARGGDAWQRTPGAMGDPASAPTSFTVGAVRATSYLDSGAEFFSSYGPTHGGIPKPDVAGPDGLSGAVYGTLGFYGTSASTPAVAGAAALLLSGDPSLTPLQAGTLLRGSIVTPTRWEGPELQGSPALGAGRVRLAPPGTPLAGFCGGGTPAIAVFAPFLLLCRRRGPRASSPSPWSSP